MMTSLLWRHLYLEHSQSVQYFAQQFSLYNSQVLNSIVSYEKSEQVQQANVFKRQTLLFHFFDVSSEFIETFIAFPSHASQTAYCCDSCIGRRNNTATRFFLINTVVTMSKLFTPDMYCSSRKTLVTIHWTHLRLNGICAKFFLPTANE